MVETTYKIKNIDLKFKGSLIHSEDLKEGILYLFIVI